MLPVLFSVGGLTISSFGFFLTLGFLLGIFLVWRLCRAWDLNEENILDLTFITFIGGLVGARLYFVVSHLNEFISVPYNIILINKFPGLSFWGGLLGGWLTLYFFAKRKRNDFWQLADIAAVGFLGGLILANIGCFLGGCNVGISSKAFFAIAQEGLLGKRWPVSFVEAMLFIVVLKRIWSKATHFHLRGIIISMAFIYIGIIRLIVEPFRQDHSESPFSIVLIVLGLTLYYKITKQNPIKQLNGLKSFLIRFLTDSKTRILVVQNLRKNWYNQKTAITWKLRNFKKVLKRHNVKLS